MTRSHDTIVDSQFGPRARAYVESAVHAGGADLEALGVIAAAAAPAHALDLGCGGGHVAYRLAPHAARVTACDLSAAMLAVVAEEAAARGLANLETAQGRAERLPFADGAFDFLASRFSAHHWDDFELGLREARRVLAADAPAVFIDICAPGAAALDTHLQSVELLRDPSHVRDYAVGEWLAGLGRAGFQVRATRSWPLRMDFAAWTERMRTPAALAAAIRILQEGASAAVRRHFAIEDDGSFMLEAVLIEATAA